MIQEQIFQLKLNALQLTEGKLEEAKLLYEWLIEEVTDKKQAAKEKALTLV